MPSYFFESQKKCWSCNQTVGKDTTCKNCGANQETKQKHEHHWKQLKYGYGWQYYECADCGASKQVTTEVIDEGIYGNEAEFDQEINSGHW